MNPFCLLTTTIILCLCTNLKGQSRVFLGFNGSGWPSNLQVRGVLQASWEKKNFAKQIELGYVRRENYTIRNPLPDEMYYYQPLIGALELSAMLKAGINFEEFRIFVLFGPSVSKGVEAEAFISSGGSSYRAVIPWDQLGIRRWEMGTYQGLGIETTGRKGVKIQVDFRYYLGLSDLLPDERSVYNQGALLGIGISLPLSHSEE
jgi:hypothetical protein